MQSSGTGQARRRAIIVGAGSAGAVLAAAIADRYDVIVLEAGRAPSQTADASGLGPTRATTWTLAAELTRDRAWEATPGRAVGGSSVVNGGYFVAPERPDLEAWHAAGGAPWQPDAVQTIITDLAHRFGVHAAPQTHPLVTAFSHASADHGCADALLVLGTSFDGRAPRNVADAFLPSSAPSIDLRPGSRALRVIVADGRATGLEVASADGTREVIEADEIILCAGAFGTARLLLASGIGPADALRAAAIDPVADLPGVGASFSDHPALWVDFTPTPELAGRASTADDADAPFPLALSLGADGGPGDDLEILVCIQPPDTSAEGAASQNAAPSGSVDAAPYGVLVGLQRPVARGTVTVTSAHVLDAPKIAYGYLEDPADRAALRTGVRRAATLLTSPAMAQLVSGLVGLTSATLDDDAELDGWIAARLGSASHTCGTAPMGSASDPLAVADGAGRVRDVAGLRIADTSLLPYVPSRGPASAAMAVGAIVAAQMP